MRGLESIHNLTRILLFILRLTAHIQIRLLARVALAPLVLPPPSDVLGTVAGGFPAADPGLAALPRTGDVDAPAHFPRRRLQRGTRAAALHVR